jgi:hypothetical protein
MCRFFAGILFLVLLTGCSAIPMLDFAGKGSQDRDLYYDVASNRIISKYKDPVDDISVWKYKGDSLVRMDRLVVDNSRELVIPQLKDSLAFYSFQVSVHLENDHWRMMRHLDISKELVLKKEKIYSRFTSH